LIVDDGSAWKKRLTKIRAAMPISLEAIIAILVLIMVFTVMMIERIREPNKEFCGRTHGCVSSSLPKPTFPSTK
jgi:hypothetical protein